MADLKANLAPDGAHVYIGSAHSGKLPDDPWRPLQGPPFNGQYDPAYPRELTFTRVAGNEAVIWLRNHGHTVILTEGQRACTDATPPPVGRWSVPCCTTCGAGFREAERRRWTEGETCPNTETTLDPETGTRVLLFDPHPLILRWGDDPGTSPPR